MILCRSQLHHSTTGAGTHACLGGVSGQAGILGWLPVQGCSVCRACLARGCLDPSHARGAWGPPPRRPGSLRPSPPGAGCTHTHHLCLAKPCYLCVVGHCSTHTIVYIIHPFLSMRQYCAATFGCELAPRSLQVDTARRCNVPMGPGNCHRSIFRPISNSFPTHFRPFTDTFLTHF